MRKTLLFIVLLFVALLQSCGFSDASHDAVVKYYNPNTGTRNTYALDVVVEDNKVVRINFPNGGYLDDSHMGPARLSRKGCCTLHTDKGYVYEVEIER